MVFSSMEFLCIFLPSVLLLNFIIKEKYSNILLLGFSLLFYYIGEPEYIFFFLGFMLINYVLAILIDYTTGIRKKSIFWMTIILDLGFLFYYKYSGFFVETIGNLGITFENPEFFKNIIMPIGISFFTFQTLSYIADLYMGKVSVQKNPLKLCLYVSLFPQLIAGPIVKYKEIDTELCKRRISSNDIHYGIQRFCIGLGKKVIIANQAAVIADIVFSYDPSVVNTFDLWIGMFAYTLQIYFDFSGYSDMAIGIGRILGFHFMENFNYPYISKSIQEFWRRWHISLSTFFKEYLYIPLGGNRKGVYRTYINNLIVFALCGFWHGAEWTFLIWGLYHGFFIIIEKFNTIKNIKKKLPEYVNFAVTFFIVMFGWVFFRAENAQYGLKYIRNLMPNISSGGGGAYIPFTAYLNLKYSLY